jgi:hypothetical protein
VPGARSSTRFATAYAANRSIVWFAMLNDCMNHGYRTRSHSGRCMTIGISAISGGGSRKTAGSMKTIAGVNALFLSVWTGKSCAAAAAPPKMTKISQPSVWSESCARLGTSRIADSANSTPRKILALFES